MMEIEQTPKDILVFWFDEIDSAMWWKRDEAFDQQIREKFSALHQHASAGALYQWRTSAEGRLAEIIILDQFSRNMFRDSPQAFAQDPLAVALCQEGIERGLDLQLTDVQRSFFYMPLMHSEHAMIHELAVTQFSTLEKEDNLKFELLHKKIIDQFGRYPHRNAVLGRKSSPEEIIFLKDPSSPRF